MRPYSIPTRIRGLLALSTLILSAFTSLGGITWKYNQSWCFPPPTPLHNWCYVDNVRLDMLGYARDYATLRGGSRSSVQVFLVANNAYGWKMKYYVPARRYWITCGFDMLAVAQWQGIRNGYDRTPMRIKNWGTYIRNFNDPYSWRGAYWISGCR